MSSLITLNKDYNIKVSSNINNYLNPDYVYIPILKDYKLLVKNKEIVRKEQVILINKENTITCPISGVVVGMTDCVLYNGIKSRCLVIENDFKERMFKRNASRKTLNNISFEELLEIMKNKHVYNDNNESLYDLFKEKVNTNTLIINCVEDEPYIVSEEFEARTYINEILEMISALMGILNIKNAKLVFKNIDRDNIECYNNVLGTYPNIKVVLVPDLYLLGKRNLLLKHLSIDSNKVLHLNIHDIYKLYNIIKRNRSISEKLITVSGDGVINPQVFNVKIGTNIGDLVKDNIKLKDGVSCISNGLMAGTIVDYKKLIVTENLQGIVFTKIKECNEIKCIKCGKCSEICPMNINPEEILHSDESKNREKCINCGLCNYICPSYIDLCGKVRGEDHE